MHVDVDNCKVLPAVQMRKYLVQKVQGVRVSFIKLLVITYYIME